MEKFTAVEKMLMVFVCSICLVLLISVIGMAFYPTNSINVGLREAVIDLLKFIVGGIFGAISANLKLKSDKDILPPEKNEQ
jgi:hypothetical protein